MLRIFLTTLTWVTLSCMVVFGADEPAKGTSVFTCDPAWDGVRFDLNTPMPLHLMVLTGIPFDVHQPTEALVLVCSPKASCEVSEGASAIITLESYDRQHGYAGTYEVTQKDGKKQAGRFVAVPRKQNWKNSHGGCT